MMVRSRTNRFAEGGDRGWRPAVLILLGVGMLVLPGLATAQTNLATNGDFQSGFFNTGWTGGCGISGNSYLGNGWGWNNTGNFRTAEESSVVHGGNRSQRLNICTGGNGTGGGLKEIIWENVTIPAGHSFTYTVWARFNNGNCPAIMCWNEGENQNNPEVAYGTSRYQWVTADNWGKQNTWVTNSLTGTSPASGKITIMAGGASHPGGTNVLVYIDDITVYDNSPVECWELY